MLYVLNLLDVTLNFPTVAMILINNSNRSLYIMCMCDMICPLTKFHVPGCNSLSIILSVSELNKVLQGCHVVMFNKNSIFFCTSQSVGCNRDAMLEGGDNKRSWYCCYYHPLLMSEQGHCWKEGKYENSNLPVPKLQTFLNS